jgi:hypothetical protein
MESILTTEVGDITEFKAKLMISDFIL